LLTVLADLIFCSISISYPLCTSLPVSSLLIRSLVCVLHRASMIADPPPGGHSPRPPSRRVEQLRRQVRRGSGADDNDINDDHDHNHVVESDDFTFEGFFTGNFDVIPQPRIVSSYHAHTAGDGSRGSVFAAQKSSPALRRFISDEEERRQVAVDREEANEFFPSPPSGSKLGDLLLSSDDDSSLSCSNASTPPPQSFGDALQRSFKLLHVDDTEPLLAASIENRHHASLTTQGSSWSSPTAATKPPSPIIESSCAETIAQRRGYTNTIQPLLVPSPNISGARQLNELLQSSEETIPPIHTQCISAPEEPYSNGMHSNTLDIMEPFASCRVEMIAPCAAAHSGGNPATSRELLQDQVRNEEHLSHIDPDATPAAPFASSPSDTRPRTLTPPTPVTAAMQAALKNTEVFDWFELDEDEGSGVPLHHHSIDWAASIPSVQEVGLDAVVSYVPSMMALESSAFYGTSPQHSMSIRHTQGTSSPVVSITSTSFHGALARFHFPPAGEDALQYEIAPVVRQRSQVMVQPQAVVQRRLRHEAATQTTTPRDSSKDSISTSTSRGSLMKLPRILSPSTLSHYALRSRYLNSSSSDSDSGRDDSPQPMPSIVDGDDQRAEPMQAPSPSLSVDSVVSAVSTLAPMEQLPSSSAFAPSVS
jgi:hypothetical protein